MHHQTTSHGNKSIHWTHQKPFQRVIDFDIYDAMPNLQTQTQLRRDFIILATRIVTKHLAAFKPLSPAVVRHIPHVYSDTMTEVSTSVCINTPVHV